MIIWVLRENYAYCPEEPPQELRRLYKQVDIGEQPLSDFIAQHGVDGAEMPVMPDEDEVTTEAEDATPVQEKEEVDESDGGGARERVQHQRGRGRDHAGS